MITAEDVKELTPKAQQAVVDLYAEYRKKLSHVDFMLAPPGYIANLRKEYEEKLKAIVREGVTDVRNDRNVRIECPDCKRRDVIAGDVQRWSCVCSPNISRYTFQTSVEGL